MTTMMMAGAVVKSGNVDEASIMVEYNANDVNTDEGRAIVENRIRLAASQICGPTRYGELKSVARILQNRACFNEAVEGALHNLDKFTATIKKANNDQSAI